MLEMLEMIEMIEMTVVAVVVKLRVRAMFASGSGPSVMNWM